MQRGPNRKPPGRAPNCERGIYGAVSPRAIALPRGGYRLYYAQILPRPGAAAGAVDYGTSSRILSAFSTDCFSWMPEAGVRLSTPKSHSLLKSYTSLGEGTWPTTPGIVLPTVHRPQGQV
jgi:hypothetical protein